MLSPQASSSSSPRSQIAETAMAHRPNPPPHRTAAATRTPSTTTTTTGRSIIKNRFQPSTSPSLFATPKKRQQQQLLPSPILKSQTTTSSSSSARPQLLPRVTHARSDNGLIALRYEQAVQAKPPIPVIVAPPRSPPQEQHPALRAPAHDSAPTNHDRHWGGGKGDRDDAHECKRDSGLAPTTSHSSHPGTTSGSLRSCDGDNVFGIVIDFDQRPSGMTTSHPPQSPTMEQSKDASTTDVASRMVKSTSVSSDSKWILPGSRKNSPPRTPQKNKSQEEFTPITTPIPTDSLMEDGFLDGLSFSNRGSVMFGGKKAVDRPNLQTRAVAGRRQPSISMLASPTINVLSEDVERESQKVRSMYEQGNLDWEDGSTVVSQTNIGEVLSNGLPQQETDHLSPLQVWVDRPGSALTTRSEYRREFERAGGIEDWEDVRGGDVDRYGFISLRKDPSRPGTPELRPPQRVSTVLQLASEAPRRSRAFGRSPSTATSPSKGGRTPNRKVSARSLKTQGSTSSQRSTRASLRAAANRLPGNQDRRWMDEAGDMLTLPPGLADIAEDEEGGRAAAAMKRKEVERADKWRKMAKVIKTGKDGEGMHFEFDTKNPKLIERTWKGIPDRWRSEAWFSFLSASARKKKDSPTDEAIIAAFHKFLDTSSADDVQIDIDVPRTINSHIMFRRRYRGGQRLLFRVLHCLSLYFPNTGYVQGMASLAATLLCYYDEERCFIMLVRMWTLRGLDKLYEPGFPGLMASLDEFQTSWLNTSNVAVAAKLVDLGIDATAYGTRWYLTLFNYSIPFPAQLRVWDVFMLLGDADPTQKATTERPFQGGLDVLHATGAALVDGTREILLDSDFENAMKVLTGWIPVRDEELLMRVVGVEWRNQRKRAR